MAFDQHLADRMRQVFSEKNISTFEKNMFGGICFMVDDKMCIGIYKGGLMARVEPDEIDELIIKEGASQMIHGSRPMKGYVMIGSAGFDADDDLEFWIQKCIEFNPKAKASKKKKKK